MKINLSCKTCKINTGDISFNQLADLWGKAYCSMPPTSGPVTFVPTMEIECMNGHRSSYSGRVLDYLFKVIFSQKVFDLEK